MSSVAFRVETSPASVVRARHAVARDERRRYFQLVPLAFDPLRPRQGEKRVYLGIHSDIGGLYDDNHDMADATLAWIADGAAASGLRLKPYARLRRNLDPRHAPRPRLLPPRLQPLGPPRRLPRVFKP